MIEQAQRFLTPGFTAGTKAIDNYDECCRWLGFKRSLRRKFGMMQMLYAKNATPEGYSVWMIAHTNLREHFNRDRKWYNKFMSPDLLKEIWFDPTDQEGSLKDTSIRVCFAKARNGSYVFQGVYKPEKIAYEKVDDGQIELVRTFKKISKIYPMESEGYTQNVYASYKSDDKYMSSKFVQPKEESIEAISMVVDKCKIKADILESNKETTVIVDLELRPFQKALIGKKIGETFTLPNVNLTYKIKEILIEG